MLLVSLTCGGAAFGQATSETSSGTNVIELPPTTVVEKLDVAREQIVPSLGATEYQITSEQIKSLPLGENARFDQLILHMPGVAQDSLGQLHVRGEHANLQYRLNDVLLPEGITGFGQELDTRFVDTISLVTGSLPAQYGFRTAGIIDIHTKNGALAPGGEVSVLGGSYDTIKPSLEYGGSKGNFNYYAVGSYNHNGIGIENPTDSSRPIHDYTDQYKAFLYGSYVLDDTSRISLIGSVSYADFQIPNVPGVGPGTSPSANMVPWWTYMTNQYMASSNFDSTTLDERQNEQNYYAVLAYQKSAGNMNFQISGFGRQSSAHFMPDQIGDLFFNGVAADVDRKISSAGVQADFSYALGDKHTIRAGFSVLDEVASTHSSITVFGTDMNVDPTNAPFAIPDNSTLHALLYGVYLQDEWKITDKLTLNFGARFDAIDSFVDQNQASPRANIVYQATTDTTMHAGYARYFTPPALEFVPSESVHLFDPTSNQATYGPNAPNDPVRSERSHYFDAGITHKFAPGLQAGVDGYYKIADDQLDDGFFGPTRILSNFNYTKGKVYGAEFTANYTKGGFATYANVAYSVAQGKEWSSAQFLFTPDDAAYVTNNYIHLDHDQAFTGSFGISYLWKYTKGATRLFADALYGSGLRTSNVHPNDSTLPSYYSVTLGGEQSFKVGPKQLLKARLDVVNVTDNVYQLRNGSGVGVNAPQYGIRLGFFGTLSLVF